MSALWRVVTLLAMTAFMSLRALAKQSPALPEEITSSPPQAGPRDDSGHVIAPTGCLWHER